MKNCKKALALLLALLMSGSLCACAAPVRSAPPAAGNEAEPLAAQATEPPLSGETDYVSEYLTVYERGDEYLMPRLYTDSGFYTLNFRKVGDDIPEGVEPEYEDQFAVYENVVCFVGFDGSVTTLEAFVSSKGAENTAGLKDYTSGAQVYGFAFDAGGRLCIMEEHNSSWYDGPAGIGQTHPDYWRYRVSQRDYILRRLDGKSGAELSRTVLSVPQEESLYTHTFTFDAAGNILVTDEDGLRLFSPEGVPLGQISTPGYPDSLICYDDGRVALSFWEEGEFCFAFADTAAMTLGERHPIPSVAFSLTPGAGEYELFYTEGSAFYGYDADSDREEKLFTWMNCGVDQSAVGPVKALPDGSFITVTNRYTGGEENHSCEASIVTIRELPVEHIPQKNTLSLATVYLDSEVASHIADINRRSETVRVEVVDYSDFASGEDPSISARLLTSDLLAGKSFDLIDLRGIPYKLLASRGVLEDLYPWLDGDGELSRQSILPALLGSLELNGALYSTATDFVINSLAGSLYILGGRENWSYAELDRVLSAMPEGCEVLNLTTTSADILSRWLPFELDKCIDWQSGDCNFNAPSFLALLDFAARFPRSFDWDNYVWSENDSLENRLTQGRQLLTENSIQNFDALNYNTAWFGGDICYVGYPGLEESFRGLIQVNGRFAIGANSSAKAEAWELLRVFFTEAYQAENCWDLPGNAALFEKRLAEAMTAEYLVDEEGQFVLDEAGEKIELPQGSMGSAHGSVVSIYAVDERQEQMLRSMLASELALDNYELSNAVYELVLAGAEKYFDGQLSAADAAMSISASVSAYLSALG